MSITPTSPIKRSDIVEWELDAIELRLKRRAVVLVYGGYDAENKRVDEHRFNLSSQSVPTVTEFIAACPAGPNFKRQAEAFGANLHPDLVGTAS